MMSYDVFQCGIIIFVLRVTRCSHVMSYDGGVISVFRVTRCSLSVPI